MAGGWIKSHRQILESAVFQDPELLKVWIWCLHRASHREQHVPMSTGRGVTVVTIGPGQFVFGRHEAALELLMKPSSVRNRMQKLKCMENVDIQPARHFSIVTICNWDRYQNGDDDDGQASGQPKDNQRTTKGQPKDTYKNAKNVKNVKNEDPHTPKGGSSAFDAFWQSYPRKVGKGAAIRSFERQHGAAHLDAILAAIQWQAQSEQWRRDGGQYIPHPATWLNQQRWLDEQPARVALESDSTDRLARLQEAAI